MLNERVPVEIRRHKLTVEMEGFTQLEILGFAGAVSERMHELEQKTGIVDTYKLALRTCMDFAAELSRLKTQQENERALEDQKLDGMIAGLQSSLG